MIEKIKKDICNYYLPVIAIFIYIAVMQFTFGEICPIKLFFNFDCPGCGLTHATIYVLKGQFLEAIRANYTVFFWLLLLGLFFVDRYVLKLKKNVLRNFGIFVCAITIFRYVCVIICG